jgi:hypothetical protein
LEAHVLRRQREEAHPSSVSMRARFATCIK